MHRSGGTCVNKSVAKWGRHAKIHPSRGTVKSVAEAMEGPNVASRVKGGARIHSSGKPEAFGSVAAAVPGST